MFLSLTCKTTRHVTFKTLFLWQKSKSYLRGTRYCYHSYSVVLPGTCTCIWQTMMMNALSCPMSIYMMCANHAYITNCVTTDHNQRCNDLRLSLIMMTTPQKPITNRANDTDRSVISGEYQRLTSADNSPNHGNVAFNGHN